MLAGQRSNWLQLAVFKNRIGTMYIMNSGADLDGPTMEKLVSIIEDFRNNDDVNLFKSLLLEVDEH